MGSLLFFFFQAEDGIRDWSVTGVQTCALPISGGAGGEPADEAAGEPDARDGDPGGVPAAVPPDLHLHQQEVADPPGGPQVHGVLPDGRAGPDEEGEVRAAARRAVREGAEPSAEAA